ncbi:uncharacterized protein LTR77_008247 [Saxophila tyrrhenica]|uniref:YDG domain-containing protein n=1 Tax=Saxophila tyrrhenica TaxID=1690608 RepID=A0AAV9P584_9PEZI|nr:hypothetical protein LTR77_008247 [Saxophila tyrrhenica]
MAMIIRSGRRDESKIQDSVYDLDYLRHQSRWIRDDLDPQVARSGPDALHSDDCLKLDEFLRRLLTSNISLDDIRFSRLHKALATISGQATRWPGRLIDRADAVLAIWENNYGSLKRLPIPLYEPGGRLYGICRPEDLNREKLIIKWLKEVGVKLSPMHARRVGDLGFKPGDWWINPLFAFRDGIIDSGEPAGGVVSDDRGAYAVLMTEEEEVNGPSPDAFTYRAREHDRGRYRLTSATRESRQPVRILRSHSLRSFWAPRAGIRYDGLHVVVGWSISASPKTKRPVYEIQFKRLDSELKMSIVLRRPFADELEDYREYKRLRQAMRESRHENATPRIEVPLLEVSLDGSSGSASFSHSRRDSIRGLQGDDVGVWH